MIFTKRSTYLVTSRTLVERQDWRLRCDGDGGVGLVSVLDNYVELVFGIVLRDLSQAGWQIFTSAVFWEGRILRGLVASRWLIVVTLWWFVAHTGFCGLHVERGHSWRIFLGRKGGVLLSTVAWWRMVVIPLWRWRLVPSDGFCCWDVSCVWLSWLGLLVQTGGKCWINISLVTLRGLVVIALGGQVAWPLLCRSWSWR